MDFHKICNKHNSNVPLGPYCIEAQDRFLKKINPFFGQKLFKIGCYFTFLRKIGCSDSENNNISWAVFSKNGCPLFTFPPGQHFSQR